MSRSAPQYQNPEFDDFAENYDEALERGLSVSGENKDYFAAGRVRWLERCLGEAGFVPRTVLDFGCGTGSATPYLLGIPGVERLVGIEVSAKSIAVARRLHAGRPAEFRLSSEYEPAGDVDLAFCNGVFHHIPPGERVEAIRFVLRSLRPGGWFALWENNPWNPGTRYVMSRIPFDRDAIPLSVLETRRLLREGGFAIERSDFLFLFPRVLRWLRWIEPGLHRLPLGAQYQVLAKCTSK